MGECIQASGNHWYNPTLSVGHQGWEVQGTVHSFQTHSDIHPCSIARGKARSALRNPLAPVLTGTCARSWIEVKNVTHKRRRVVKKVPFSRCNFSSNVRRKAVTLQVDEELHCVKVLPALSWSSAEACRGKGAWGGGRNSCPPARETCVSGSVLYRFWYLLGVKKLEPSPF